MTSFDTLTCLHRTEAFSVFLDGYEEESEEMGSRQIASQDHTGERCQIRLSANKNE